MGFLITLLSRSQEILIQAGQSHVLNVVPTKHFSTTDFMELYKEDRKCALKTDVDEGTLFNHYSQKGCIFECILKTMVSVIIMFHYIIPLPSSILANRRQTVLPGTYHCQEVVTSQCPIVPPSSMV